LTLIRPPQEPEILPVREAFLSILARRRGLAVEALDLNLPIVAFGLDSLGVSEVLHELEATTGVVLDLAEALGAESLRDLCATLERTSPDRDSQAPEESPSEALRETGDFPLSEGQRSLYYLQQLDPEGTAYHLESAAWIEGAVPAEDLELALAVLCQRHSSLRTTFPAPDGEPIQRVAAVGAYELLAQEVTESSSEAVLEFAEKEARRPFDLAEGPLLRVGLWRVRGRSLLLLVVPHLVADLGSLSILWRELAVLCGGSQEDRRKLLDSPAAAFHHHSQGEGEWLRSPQAEEQEKLWRKRLQALPDPLAFPTDRPRPALQSFRGGSQARRLSPARMAAVNAVARRTASTAFVPLLVSWQAVLARWSGQGSFPLGSLDSGRFRADTGSLVGYLVNPFVLTANLRRDEDLENSTRRLGPSVLEALAQVRYPFRRLVENSNRERDPSRSPFFQVLFALQTAHGEEGERLASFLMGDGKRAHELGPWRLRPISIQRRGAQFDLSLMVAPERGGGAGVRLEYCSDLFDPSTVHRLLDHWQRFLERAGTPGLGVGEVPLLGEGELHQILVEGADTERSFGEAGTSYGSTSSVGAWIRGTARRHPGSVAVRWQGGTLAYGELMQWAGRLAKALRQAGAGPEKLVGLDLPRGPELVVALVACLRCGAPFLPLDVEDPPNRRQRILAKATPVLVLREEDVGKPSDSPLGEADSVEWVPVDAENLAYVLFTSGSTGEPKGAANRHGGLLNRLLWMQETYGLTTDDRVLQKTPSTFDVSLWELLWPLMFGAEMVLAPPEAHRDPEMLVGSIRNDEITIVHFVPSLLRELLREPDISRCSSLRLLICSGEELPADLAQGVFEAFGTDLRLENLYGPTEAAIDVSSWRCRPGASERPALGWPIANLSMRVLDRTLKPVPPGTRGELFLGGEGLGRAYLGDPALTARSFIPDPFGSHPAGGRLYRSGDLASQAPGGPFQFHGRLDQQVKVRGMRLELGDVESALRRHPRVVEAVAVVRSDFRLQGDGLEESDLEKSGPGELATFLAVRRFSGGSSLGRQLVAYLELASPAPAVEDLRAFLEEELPAGLIPGRLLPLDALPRTASGKVDRLQLPDPEGQRPKLSIPLLSPRDEKEKAICSAWSKVLKVTPVGIDDNFFLLGGDSIRSLQVRSELERSGWKASVAQMQRFATPRTLASSLEEVQEEVSGRGAAFSMVTAEDLPRLPPTAEDAYPLSRTQSAVIFHAQHDPDSAMYRDIFVCRCRGPWRPELLQKSLQGAVDRHPMLRSSFHLSRYSEPLQVVHEKVTAPFFLEDLRSEQESPEENLASWLEREKSRPLSWHEAPLVRFFLLRLDHDTFAFASSFFDAVLDGWSAASLTEEVLGSFAEILRGEERLRPPPETTFRDFIELEIEALASENSREFWRKRLASFTPSHLPRWREQEGPGETRIARVGVSGDRLRALEALAGEAGVPLKTALLAAHLLVLDRFQGGAGARTGFESSGRPETRDGDLVLGMHVNVLPLALVPGRETSVEWIRRVQEEELALLHHRRFPFSEMARLRRREDLIDTVFNYTRFHILGRLQDLAGPAVLGATVFNRTSFTLRVDFSVHPSAHQAELTLGVDQRLVDPAQLEVLAKAYERVLGLLEADRSWKVDELEILSSAQRHQLLVEWNALPSRRPGRDELLHGGFQDWALRTPKAPAVEMNGEILTYEELAARARLLSADLLEKGIGPEDVVGLAVERSLDLLVAVLGVLGAGAAYLPLNAQDPRPRQEALLKEARPQAIITARWPGGVPAFEGLVIDLEKRSRARSPRGPEVHDGPDPQRLFSKGLAYLLFTSGSTGRPKAVGVSHGAGANLLQACQELLRPEPGFRLLAVTPLSFDISVLELFWTWSCGGTVVLASEVERQDGLALAALLQERQVAWMQATPTTWRMLISGGWAGTVGLNILCGGEELTPSLACKLADRGEGVWNLYGPTETTVWSAASALGEEREAPPIGRPIQGTDCLVLDDCFRPVPLHVEGELFIGGAGLARGYWREPALTATAFLPNPHAWNPGSRMYRSGDRVSRRQDGRLDFLGRRDEQVKIRGHRVEPAEVVEKLEEHPSVEQAVVVLAEVAPGHQGLVAYLVSAKESTAGPQSLRSWLSSRLPRSMVPSAFVTVASLPRTSHGKVDKRELPAPEERRPSRERLGSLLNQLEALSEDEVEKLLGVGGASEESALALARKAQNCL